MEEAHNGWCHSLENYNPHGLSGFDSHLLRQKSKSHFEAETGSRRRRDTKAFPPPNPESKRVFHAPRGSSFANTIL